MAPNKAIEDVIKIFYAYRRHIRPDARLILAGPRFLPLYDAALDRLVARLGLGDAVLFTGRIPLAQLVACYQAADLFLCASRHEGFCAPLAEAMHFGLPILARAEAAVPETLGGSGVTFDRLAYPAIAELVDLLICDERLRTQIVEGQRGRLAGLAPNHAASLLRTALERLGVL
jgi:glycosyltransferase involved in cell wall biosynthesis